MEVELVKQFDSIFLKKKNLPTTKNMNIITKKKLIKMCQEYGIIQKRGVDSRFKNKLC